MFTTHIPTAKISSTLENPDIFKSGQSKFSEQSYKEFAPHLGAAITNNFASDRIHRFPKLSSNEQATIIRIVMDMVGSDNRAVQRAGYAYLQHILKDPGNKNSKMGTRISAFLFDGARARLRAQLSPNQKSLGEAFRKLSNLDVMLLACNPSAKSILPGLKYTDDGIKFALREARRARELQLKGKVELSRLPDITRFAEQNYNRIVADQKRGPRSLLDVLQNSKVPGGAPMPSDRKEAAKWDKAWVEVRNKLWNVDSTSKSRAIVKKFGTWRSNWLTDNMTIDVLLKMVKSSDHQIARQGYQNLQEILGKGGSASEKAAVYIFNNICKQLAPKEGDLLNFQQKMNALSDIELAVFDNMAPTSMVPHPKGAEHLDQERLQCTDRVPKEEKQLKITDLRDMLQKKVEEADKVIEESFLYRQEEPHKEKFNAEKMTLAKEKNKELIHKAVGKKITDKPMRNLWIRVGQFGKNWTADRAMVAAAVSATKSEDLKTSRLGHHVLMVLVQDPKMRDRAMKILRYDAFDRVHKIKREMLTPQGRRDWTVPVDAVEKAVLSKLPSVSLLAIHYHDQDRLDVDTMKTANSHRTRKIHPDYFHADGTPSVLKFWFLCRLSAGISIRYDQNKPVNMTDEAWQARKNKSQEQDMKAIDKWFNHEHGMWLSYKNSVERAREQQLMEEDSELSESRTLENNDLQDEQNNDLPDEQSLRIDESIESASEKDNSVLEKYNSDSDEESNSDEDSSDSNEENRVNEYSFTVNLSYDNMEEIIKGQTIKEREDSVSTGTESDDE